MHEHRLVEIETKVAFQERTIQQLNDRIFEQQQQIDGLNRFVAELSQRLQTAFAEIGQSKGGEIDSDSEIPPHY